MLKKMFTNNYSCDHCDGKHFFKLLRITMINCYAKKSLLGKYKLLKFIQEPLEWLKRPVNIKDNWKIVFLKKMLYQRALREHLEKCWGNRAL